MTEAEYLKLNYINDKEAIITYNKALVEKYPWLIDREYNWDTDTYTPYTNEDYSSTWLDSMPDGWRLAFGLQMCEEIQQALEEENFVDKYTILQVKEKYGGLRWYTGGAPKKVHNIVSKYEDLSYNICIECGKPAKWLSKGWISPYCDDCKQKLINKKDAYYTEKSFMQLDKDDSNE